jgi:hypothetical protein
MVGPLQEWHYSQHNKPPGKHFNVIQQKGSVQHADILA